MGRTKIDIESWSRHDEFKFFIRMSHPTFSVTSHINVDACYAAAKAKGHSFFIYYAYAIIRAINEIESLRLRAVSEPLGSEPEVYLYDVVDLITPIKISDEGKYIEMCIPYTPDFDAFYRNAEQIIASAAAAAQSNDVYITMNEQHTYACVSAMPKLYFTSISHTRTYEGGVNMITLLNVGKMVVCEGCRVVPVAISVHHGLIDGGHVSDFYCRVQEIADSL